MRFANPLMNLLVNELGIPIVTNNVPLALSPWRLESESSKLVLQLLKGVLTVLDRNKRLSKGKKGLKKRTQDPFTRKDWFSVKVSIRPLSNFSYHY